MNKFVTYKNAQIHFSDRGEGDVVVLLHGFLEDISMWNSIEKELLKVNRVICVDLLGHGKSDCLGYIHTMEGMAKVVKYVLNEVNVNSAIFIGHSMGGYVALALAEEFESMIKGLCLMNSSAQADTEERKKLRSRVVKMAQTNYEPLVSMSVSNLFFQETRKQFLSKIERSKRIALKTSIQSYIACTEGMKKRKNREFVLRNSDFKKLIITGKKDNVLSHISILNEAKRTGTEIISFSNGHMSHIENLTELKAALKEFILV